MRKYSTECPHCGNPINVTDAKEVQKCFWCRRFISVKFDKTRKKVRCEVEALDFPANQEGQSYEYK